MSRLTVKIATVVVYDSATLSGTDPLFIESVQYTRNTITDSTTGSIWRRWDYYPGATSQKISESGLAYYIIYVPIVATAASASPQVRYRYGTNGIISSIPYDISASSANGAVGTYSNFSRVDQLGMVAVISDFDNETTSLGISNVYRAADHASTLGFSDIGGPIFFPVTLKDLGWGYASTAYIPITLSTTDRVQTISLPSWPASGQTVPAWTPAALQSTTIGFSQGNSAPRSTAILRYTSQPDSSFVGSITTTIGSRTVTYNQGSSFYAATTLFFNGDIIYTTGGTTIGTVSSVIGNTITLVANCPSTVPTGSKNWRKRVTHISSINGFGNNGSQTTSAAAILNTTPPSIFPMPADGGNGFLEIDFNVNVQRALSYFVGAGSAKTGRGDDEVLGKKLTLTNQTLPQINLVGQTIQVDPTNPNNNYTYLSTWKREILNTFSEPIDISKAKRFSYLTNVARYSGLSVDAPGAIEAPYIDTIARNSPTVVFATTAGWTTSNLQIGDTIYGSYTPNFDTANTNRIGVVSNITNSTTIVLTANANVPTVTIDSMGFSVFRGTQIVSQYTAATSLNIISQKPSLVSPWNSSTLGFNSTQTISGTTISVTFNLTLNHTGLPDNPGSYWNNSSTVYFRLFNANGTDVITQTNISTGVTTGQTISRTITGLAGNTQYYGYVGADSNAQRDASQAALTTTSSITAAAGSAGTNGFQATAGDLFTDCIGTITTSGTNNTIVTGTNTRFLREVNIGSVLINRAVSPWKTLGIVLSITNDTSLTIFAAAGNANFPGTAVNNVSFSVTKMRIGDLCVGVGLSPFLPATFINNLVLPSNSSTANRIIDIGTSKNLQTAFGSLTANQRIEFFQPIPLFTTIPAVQALSFTGTSAGFSATTPHTSATLNTTLAQANLLSVDQQANYGFMCSTSPINSLYGDILVDPSTSYTVTGYIASGTLTLTGQATNYGPLRVGQFITGAGVSPSTAITAVANPNSATTTGTTYTVTPSQTIGSSGSPITLTVSGAASQIFKIESGSTTITTGQSFSLTISGLPQNISISPSRQWYFKPFVKGGRRLISDGSLDSTVRFRFADTTSSVNGTISNPNQTYIPQPTAPTVGTPTLSTSSTTSSSNITVNYSISNSGSVTSNTSVTVELTLFKVGSPNTQLTPVQTTTINSVPSTVTGSYTFIGSSMSPIIEHTPTAQYFVSVKVTNVASLSQTVNSANITSASLIPQFAFSAFSATPGNDGTGNTPNNNKPVTTVTLSATISVFQNTAYSNTGFVWSTNQTAIANLVGDVTSVSGVSEITAGGSIPLGQSSSVTFTTDVTALSPGSTYYWKAFARISGGGYRFGSTSTNAVKTFTTLEVLPAALSQPTPTLVEQGGTFNSTGITNFRQNTGSQYTGTAQGTGQLSIDPGETAVSGANTAFTTDLSIGSVLYTTAGALIGVVQSISDDINLTLALPTTVSLAGSNFNIGIDKSRDMAGGYAYLSVIQGLNNQGINTSNFFEWYEFTANIGMASDIFNIKVEKKDSATSDWTQVATFNNTAFNSNLGFSKVYTNVLRSDVSTRTTVNSTGASKSLSTITGTNFINNVYLGAPAYINDTLVGIVSNISSNTALTLDEAAQGSPSGSLSILPKPQGFSILQCLYEISPIETSVTSQITVGTLSSGSIPITGTSFFTRPLRIGSRILVQVSGTWTIVGVVNKIESTTLHVTGSQTVTANSTYSSYRVSDFGIISANQTSEVISGRKSTIKFRLAPNSPGYYRVSINGTYAARYSQRTVVNSAVTGIASTQVINGSGPGYSLQKEFIVGRPYTNLDINLNLATSGTNYTIEQGSLFPGQLKIYSSISTPSGSGASITAGNTSFSLPTSLAAKIEIGSTILDEADPERTQYILANTKVTNISLGPTTSTITLNQQIADTSSNIGLRFVFPERWIPSPQSDSYLNEIDFIQIGTGKFTLTGTGSLTSNQAIITGTGSAFTKEVRPGDIIFRGVIQLGTVSSVASDNSLTLQANVATGFTTQTLTVMKPNLAPVVNFNTITNGITLLYPLNAPTYKYYSTAFSLKKTFPFYTDAMGSTISISNKTLGVTGPLPIPRFALNSIFSPNEIVQSQNQIVESRSLNTQNYIILSPSTLEPVNDITYSGGILGFSQSSLTGYETKTRYNLQANSQTGTGSGARFNITSVQGGQITVEINNPGTGYALGNTLTFISTQIGGAGGGTSLVLTVTSLGFWVKDEAAQFEDLQVGIFPIYLIASNESGEPGVVVSNSISKNLNVIGATPIISEIETKEIPRNTPQEINIFPYLNMNGAIFSDIIITGSPSKGTADSIPVLGISAIAAVGTPSRFLSDYPINQYFEITQSSTSGQGTGAAFNINITSQNISGVQGSITNGSPTPAQSTINLSTAQTSIAGRRVKVGGEILSNTELIGTVSLNGTSILLDSFAANATTSNMTIELCNYQVIRVAGGSGYKIGDTITINGDLFGYPEDLGANDIIITVTQAERVDSQYVIHYVPEEDYTGPDEFYFRVRTTDNQYSEPTRIPIMVKAPSLLVGQSSEDIRFSPGVVGSTQTKQILLQNTGTTKITIYEIGLVQNGEDFFVGNQVYQKTITTLNSTIINLTNENLDIVEGMQVAGDAIPVNGLSEFEFYSGIPLSSTLAGIDQVSVVSGTPSASLTSSNKELKNIKQSSTTGQGNGAVFSVKSFDLSYSIQISSPGVRYAINEEVTILGSNLMGTQDNRLIIKVNKIRPLEVKNIESEIIPGQLGRGARFNIILDPTGYKVSISQPGRNYRDGDTILIKAERIYQGVTTATSPTLDQDIILTVTGVKTVPTFVKEKVGNSILISQPAVRTYSTGTTLVFSEALTNLEIEPESFRYIEVGQTPEGIGLRSGRLKIHHN